MRRSFGCGRDGTAPRECARCEPETAAQWPPSRRSNRSRPELLPWPRTGLRKHGLQQGANILASIFSEHENRCRNHQAIAILSKVWGRRGTRPVVSSFLVALPRVQAATNLIVKSTVLSPHRRREEASELTETGSMANGSGWAAAGFHNDSNFFHLAASGARFIRPNNCASVIALCC